MKSLIVGILAMAILSAAPASNAAVVTLSSSGQNLLVMQFTVAPQPPQHNALSIGTGSASYPSSPAFGATAWLYDNQTLLAQSQTTFVGQRYASSGSFFANVDPLIVYTTIANGSIAGEFRLLVTSGSATFDTNNLFVRPFGDGGSLANTAGTVTGVAVSRYEPVPEPGTLALLGLGLLGVGVSRRKA